MKNGISLTQLAAELERQQNAKRDFVADTRSIDFTLAGGAPTLVVNDNPFPLTRYASNQITEWAGIPAKYADRMAADAPGLLETNVRHWFRNTPAQRMVRTLDGGARAFLSNRYRRLDNFDLAEALLPTLMQIPDARIESCDVTPMRMHIKVVTPRITGEVKPGDVVQAGIAIANSEIGAGALSVMPLIFRLVCRNGMISADYGQRRNHIGRGITIEGEATEVFRDETLLADDRALLLKLTDITRNAVSDIGFGRILDKMRAAAGEPIKGDPVASVKELGNRFLFSETERAGVLRHLISGGDLSRWGMLNAITAHSQDVADYDRATDLERAGGQVLELAANDWQAIAAAA